MQLATVNRRHAMLAVLALQSGCGIQPLSPLPVTPVSGPEPGEARLRQPLVGQWWRYRKLNFFNSQLLGVDEEVVASIAPSIDVQRANGGSAPADERHVVWGMLTRDSAWDYPMTFEAPVPLWPATLAVNARAASRTQYRMDGGSIRHWIEVSTVATAWERLQVAAGEFDALRVERLIRLEHHDHLRLWTTRRDLMWLAPEVGRWVARETSGQYVLRGENRFWEAQSSEDRFRWELTAWH